MNIKLIGLSATLLLGACAFNSSTGQMTLDLSDLGSNSADTGSGFSGIYRNGSLGDGNRKEEMLIQQLDNRRYQVSITTLDTRKGCAFQGIGTLNGQQIEIALASVRSDLSAVMTVALGKNVASVETKNMGNINDLNVFCGETGSLLGEYRKTQ